MSYQYHTAFYYDNKSLNKRLSNEQPLKNYNEEINNNQNKLYLISNAYKNIDEYHIYTDKEIKEVLYETIGNDFDAINLIMEYKTMIDYHEILYNIGYYPFFHGLENSITREEDIRFHIYEGSNWKNNPYWSKFASRSNLLPIKFFELFSDCVNWDTISKTKLDPEVYLKYKNTLIKYNSNINIDHFYHMDLSIELIKNINLEWHKMSEFQPFNLVKLEIFQELIEWRIFWKRQDINIEIIESFKHKIIWDIVCQYQKLPNDFIERNEKYINWEILFTYQKIEEPILKKYGHKVGAFRYLLNKYIK